VKVIISPPGQEGGRDIKTNIAKLPLMERTGWWIKSIEIFGTWTTTPSAP